MSNDTRSFSMSLPLDSDRFLRRECPTCEREFKWHVPEDAPEPSSEPRDTSRAYFCPYCGVEAPTSDWHTKEQAELAKSIIYEEVVRPELEALKRTVERSNRGGGFLRMSVEISDADPAPEITATDDMRRIDFPCHPDEPVKVMDDWAREVHCLICGASVG